ncbi:MAG: tetratricopeptide repeat protein [Methanothrix sp.]|nr:tetratricopeptide repeat protein [Methanothrix sp.]
MRNTKFALLAICFLVVPVIAENQSAIDKTHDAVLLMDDEQYEPAIPLLDEALALEPEYAEAWAGKARALYFLERYEEALPRIERAITYDISNTNYWRIKGLILRQLGRQFESDMAFRGADFIDKKALEAAAPN